MNKKALFAACLLLAAAPSFAQEGGQGAESTEKVEYGTDKYKVETNRFWSNWFISAGAGAQIYFGDHDKQADFGKRLSPALDIAVGKWFTPGIGVRLMYSGLSAKGATGRYESGGLIHATGDVVPGWKNAAGGELQYSKFNYFNLHADALFNLSNLFCGYNEARVYNLSAYGGVGVMRVCEGPTATNMSGHFGVLNAFRLSSAWDLNLDLRMSVMNDNFDGEIGGRGSEGMFSAIVGLTYKFKPRGWSRAKTVVREVYNNDELNALRADKELLAQENARLRDALAQSNREPEVKQIATGNFVTFRIGKSELSNEARVSLGMLAEAIKQGDPAAVYTVTGYADAGTGSQKLNERLSKARAQAVYDCLVEEYGVDKAQLKMDYKGGVDNMFYDDPRMSRAVITKAQ